MKPISHESVARLYVRAMEAHGRRRSLMSIEWDVSNGCENPVQRTCFSRPAKPDDGRDIAIDRAKGAVPLMVIMAVRCRKCAKCLRFRQQLWAAKAIYEYRRSYRTWAATFTFSPAKHDEIRDRIRHAESKQGSDYDELSEEEQLRLRHLACSRFLTLWFKRIRKNSKAKLRYMLVMELHKSGLPHYHALIHEPEREQKISKRILENAWPYGYTRFKLLPDEENERATYACKYLSKSSLARVRASGAYGGAASGLS